MKKILIAFVIVLLVGTAILFALGNPVRTIEAKIDVAAPPEKVWSIITNIDEWSEWSPIINASSGTAKLGATLDITMMGQEEGQDGPRYAPEIIGFDAPKSLRWTTKVAGGIVMTNDKWFVLEPTATGTRVSHKELFSGMMVPLFWSMFEEGVPTMLNSMNDALKAKAEESIQ